MRIVLNIIFGLLAGVLADLVMRRMAVADPLKIIIAILIGVVVFIANIGGMITS